MAWSTDIKSTAQAEIMDAWVPGKGLLQLTTSSERNSLLHCLTRELRKIINFPSCEICTPQWTQMSQVGEPSPPTLPDRVIEILGSSTAESITLRLQTTQSTKKGHYIALSHRWGGKMTLKTTKSSLNRLTTGFSLSDVPRTFQDAILVAKALEVNYLWIDSLCIVQDDHEEWIEQSAKMGSIYHKAAFTIAAHSPGQCHEGFLWRYQVPSALRINPQHGGPEFFVSIPELHIKQFHRSFFQSEITQRAWVLQELTLSPRILHFVENSLIWECEHRPPDFRSRISMLPEEEQFNHRDGLYALPLETSATIFRKVGTELGLYAAWLQLVQQYSDYQMTKKGDKLVALAGIVHVLRNKIANPNERHYHCGVFQSDIERSLMWYKQEESQGHLERAPSWSWASTDGRLYFDALEESDDDLRSWILVKGFRHQDYFDQSVSQPTCHLAVKAPIIRATGYLHWEKRSRLRYAPRHSYNRIVRIYKDGDGRINLGWCIGDERRILPGRVGIFPPGERTALSFLAVWGRQEGGKPVRVWCLMVSPVDEKAAVYRRIGLGFVDDVEALEQALESPEDITLI